MSIQNEHQTIRWRRQTSTQKAQRVTRSYGNQRPKPYSFFFSQFSRSLHRNCESTRRPNAKEHFAFAANGGACSQTENKHNMVIRQRATLLRRLFGVVVVRKQPGTSVWHAIFAASKFRKSQFTQSVELVVVVSGIFFSPQVRSDRLSQYTQQFFLSAELEHSVFVCGSSANEILVKFYLLYFPFYKINSTARVHVPLLFDKCRQNKRKKDEFIHS